MRLARCPGTETKVRPSDPAERIEWSRPADLDGVEVLLVDNCARRWRQFHETYTVCTGLAISQPAEWRYRGKAHFQTADGLMLLEPGELHANTRITQPASFRVALIGPSVVACAAEMLGLAPGQVHFKLAQVHGGPLHRAFTALHASLEAPATRLERQSRFSSCLQLLIEHCTETGSRPAATPIDTAAVRRARQFIHEHVADPIGLDNLVAASGGASRFHLVRAFAAATGLPPHAYQIHLRMTRAKKLLSGGVATAQVAADLGFADQSHFTRHFRRVFGVTPGAYATATAPRSRALRHRD